MASIKHRFDENKFRVEFKEKLDLSKRKTTADKRLEKTTGQEALASDVTKLREAQRVLYASGTHSLLIILQGMDAAGKDGTIRRVLGAVNPQGCRVYSFKAPNSTEVEHHFLWRAMPCLPSRGMISVFNRSYYEETIVVRVHPEFLIPQNIPGISPTQKKSLRKLWTTRFQEIRSFEQTLTNNGTKVLKFFLHVSQDEQKERFLERLTRDDKHWKFNARDLEERQLWPEYQNAFEHALSQTSTLDCPWFVIPADNKWFARAAIADIISANLDKLDLKYPEVPIEESKRFNTLAEQLQNE